MCVDIEEQIRQIEEEILRTQKNKATEHHLGLLKAKLARLRRMMSTGTRGSSSRLRIKKEGHATVSMIGFPSVGKSSLLNVLTNAKSKVASYEFTTVSCIPAVIDYNKSKIQILDLPGIIEGAATGKGMGKEILSYARISDLLLIVTDVDRLDKLGVIINELEFAGFRLNEQEPNIDISITQYGGISISSSLNQLNETQNRIIKDVLREAGIHNAKIVFHERFDLDRFIDKLSKNRKYIKAFVVVNKSELLPKRDHIEKISINGKEFDCIYVSAITNYNINLLKDVIWNYLDLIRIYTVKQNGELDDEPLILKKGATVRTVCSFLHRDLLRFFRYAKVNGTSVRFSGQKVGLDHVLNDGDVLTIYTK